MFELTQKIIEEAEANLVKFTFNNKHLNKMARWVWFPLMYLAVGLKDFYKPAKFWIFSLTVLLLILALLFENFVVLKEYSPYIFNFCLYFSMVLAIFSMPSTYAYYGVEKEYIINVLSILETEGIKTVDDIELLEQNIEKVHDRIAARVSFYKWIVGMSWTIYLLVISIETRFIAELDDETLSQAISDNISTFVLTAFATLAALSLVVGYKRASETLIKSIEFACVEYKALLLKKTS